MDITIMNNVCLKPREVDCPVCKGEGSFLTCLCSGEAEEGVYECHFCEGRGKVLAALKPEMTHTDLVFDNGVLVQAVGNGKQVRCSEVPVKTVDELGLCPVAPTASIPAKGLRNMWGLLGSKKQEPAEEPLGDLRIDNGVISRKTKGWD